MPRPACDPIELRCVFHRNSEFVLPQARRNIRVRSGIHVRIDAQGDLSDLSDRTRALLKHLHFGRRFHVEQQDAVFQGQIDFFLSLTHAGEDYLLRIRARLESAKKLTAGDDVESRA